MELKYLLPLTLSFLTFGCGAEVLNSPSETAAFPTSEAQPKTQLAKVEEQTVIKSGSFIAVEHPTEGTVQIVPKNGKPVLELDQAFKTDMGPDLVVILHRAENVLESTKPPSYPLQEGDYVILAPLQKFEGAQSYPIPEDINLEDYNSAVIWCREFNATFGTATLDDTGSVSAQ